MLCAAAAVRSGAGLVTLAVPKSQLAVVAARGRREMMTLPLAERAGVLSGQAASQVLSFVRSKRVTSLAVGPGLRVTPGTARLVRVLWKKAGVPMVLDADGLNALSRGRWPGRPGAPVAVTPHPGELARLLNMPTRTIQSGRMAAARRMARRGVVCVLKGEGTLVDDGRRALKNATGNAGLAKGGSGDVLTGVIAALVAQVRAAGPGERLARACAAGVHVHGAAADIAARAKTRIGLAAGDVVETLPRAFRAVFGRKI